jgi:hypothetical protein
VLQWRFPQLYSFALNKNIYVKDFRAGTIERLFYILCLMRLQCNYRSCNCVYKKYKLTHLKRTDGAIYRIQMTTQKAYLQIIGINDASPILKLMWKSCVMEKHKFFLCLLLQDRLNTREMLRKKNMELDDYSYVLCRQNVEESLFHLFFECHFNKWCWRFVKVQWNTSLSPQDMLIRARRQFNSIFFREIIMVAGWMIWCHRNAVIFDGAAVSLSRWREAFRDEFSLIMHRANPSTKSSNFVVD